MRLFPIIITVFLAGCSTPAIVTTQLGVARDVTPKMAEECNVAQVDTTTSGWIRWGLGFSPSTRIVVTCEVSKEMDYEVK